MRRIQLRDRHRHHTARKGRGGLSTLSREIIGNIYQALTGTVHMPSGFVRRALANGLPADEFQHAISSARNLRMLPKYLLAASEQKLERAHYWDELGLRARARDLYLESALWGLYAELLSGDEEEEKKQIIFNKYRQSYRNAAPFFIHSAEELSIPYLAGSLSGYFRQPESRLKASEDGRIPVVILLNDMFSAREELHFLENSLLAQGFATLAFDYPGVHEHSAQLPSSYDVKELGNSLYLYLSGRDEIDCSRITLYGLSLGGRMAIQMALANPERFASIVSMSTPLDLLADLERLAPVYAREHMVSAQSARTALFELAMHTQIEECIEYIEAPFLVVGGGKDRIAPADATRRIFERAMAADKKLIICPGAGHCLYEMMPSLRYEVAQWISQRV